MTKKTWQDIETRALHEPVLHLAVSLVRRGDLTQEEALIAAALGLSEMRENLHQAMVDQINLCTCRNRFVIPAAPGTETT